MNIKGHNSLAVLTCASKSMQLKKKEEEKERENEYKREKKEMKNNFMCVCE